MASSIGSTTELESSSGLAPGSDRATLTVAGSAFGKRSTPRSRNEKSPSTTSDITSIVAETGRRTQNSESTTLPLPGHGDQLAVRQRVDIRDGHRLAFLDAGGDLDAIADPLANLELAHSEPIVLDDEHAVDAVAVLKRRIRERQDLVHLPALHVHPGKGPRLEGRIGVRHDRLERKRPGRGVHDRADAGDLARKGAVAVRV